MNERLRKFIESAYQVSGRQLTDEEIQALMDTYGDDPVGLIENVGNNTGLNASETWNPDAYFEYIMSEEAPVQQQEQEQPQEQPEPVQQKPEKPLTRRLLDDNITSFQDVQKELEDIDGILGSGYEGFSTISYERLKELEQRKAELEQFLSDPDDPIDINTEFQKRMEGKDKAQAPEVMGGILSEANFMKDIYQEKYAGISKLLDEKYADYVPEGEDYTVSDVIDESIIAIKNGTWDKMDEWKRNLYTGIYSSEDKQALDSRYKTFNQLSAQGDYLRKNLSPEAIAATQEWVRGEGQSYRESIAEWINDNMRFDAKIMKPVEYLSSAVASGLLQSKQSDILEYDDYSGTIGDKSLEDLAIEDLVRLSEITKLSQEIQEARPSLKTYFGESNFTTFADEAPYAGFSSLISLFTQEELGQSAAVGAAAGTAVGGPMGGLAGGIGYGVAAGMSLGGLDMEFAALVMDRAMEYAADNGLDVTDPQDLRKIFGDKDFMSNAVADATLGSGIVFAVDLATLGISGPIAGKAASALFRGARDKAVSNAAISLVVEGAGGATGEFLKQLAVEDEIDGMEIALEGGAEFFGPGLGQVIAVNVSEKQKSKARSQIVSAAREGDKEGFETGVDALYKRGAISKKQRNELIDEYDQAAEIFKTIPEDIISDRASREEAAHSILERNDLDNQLDFLNTELKNADEGFKPRIQKQIDELNQKRDKLNEYINTLGDTEMRIQDFSLKNRLMANLSSNSELNLNRSDVTVNNGVVSVAPGVTNKAISFIQDAADGTNGVTFNESQRVVYDQENDQWIQSSEQVRKEPGAVQDTQGGTQEAQAGGVLQEEGQQQGNQAQGTQEEIKLTDPKPVTLFDVIDTVDEFEGKRVIAVNDTQGNQGTLTIDEGGKVAVDINGQIREIGNVEEIFDTPISELSEALPGLQASGDVQVQGNYTYNFEGNTYANNYSDPLTAINYDENGNVESVTLDRRVTVGGYAGRPTTTEFRSETITGPRAEELALQISLEKLENDGKARQFQEFSNSRMEGAVQQPTSQGETQTGQRVPETGAGQTTSGPQEGDKVAYQKADGTTRELTYQDGRWTFVTESGKPRMYPAPFQGNATRQWEAQQQPTTGQADGATDGAVNYDTLFEKYPSSEQEISDADLVGVLNSFDNMAEMADEGRTGPAPGRRRNPGDYLNEVVNRLRDVLTQETFDRIKGDLNPTGLQAAERYFGLTDETTEQATEETVEQATEETTPSPEEKPAPKPKPKKKDSKTKAREFAKKMFGSRGKISAGKIIDQIEKVTSAISEIAPNVKFKVVDSTQMAKLTGTTEARSPRGRYDSSTNTVYINSDKAIGTTVYHEAAHAVMVNMYGDQNPKVVEIHKAIRDVLKNGNKNQQLLAQRIDDFVKAYQQDEGNPYLDSHEFFAELVGQLAADKEIIEAPTITKKIIKAINDVLEDLIGVRPFETDADINDIIDFVNTLAVNFESGEIIPNAENLSKKKAEDMNSTFDQRDPITNEEYVEISDEDLAKGQMFTVYRRNSDYRNGFLYNDLLINGKIKQFTENAIQIEENGTTRWIPRSAFYVDASGRYMFKRNFGNSYNQNFTKDDINFIRLLKLQYPDLTLFDMEEILVDQGIDITRNQITDILTGGETPPNVNSITNMGQMISTVLEYIPTITDGLLIDYLLDKGYKASVNDMVDAINDFRDSKEFLQLQGVQDWMLKRYNGLIDEGIDVDVAKEQIAKDLGLPGAAVSRVEPIIEALVNQENDIINNQQKYKEGNVYHAYGMRLVTAVKNMGKTIRQWFTVNGKLPKKFAEILREKDQLIAAMNTDIRMLSNDFKDLVVSNNLQKKDVRILDRILKGANPNILRLTTDRHGKKIKNAAALEKELLDKLSEMRYKINNLSKAIADVANPYADNVFVNFIRKNDTYVTRIYKRFETSNWSRTEMGEETWKKMYDYLLNQEQESLRYSTRRLQEVNAEIADLKNQGNLSEAQADWLKNLEQKAIDYQQKVDVHSQRINSKEELEGIMEQMLVDADNLWSGYSKIDGVTSESVLKKRSDLPEVIREFYGEIKDPYVNFQFTMTKMASTYASIQAMEKLREHGLGTWFSKMKTTQFDTRVSTISTNNNKIAVKALLGTDKDLWTTSEIAESIAQFNRETPKYIQAIFSLNALVKKGFTVWSPKVHMRNFLSNTFFILATGNLPGGPVDTLETFYMLYDKIPGKKFREKIQKAIPSEYLRNKVTAITMQPNDSRERAMVRDRKTRITEKGVLDQTVDVKEMEFYLETGLFGSGKEKITEDYLLDNMIDRRTMRNFVKDPLGATKRKLLKIDQRTTDLYQVEDDFWKGYLFLREAERYGKVLVGKGYKQLEREIGVIKYDKNGNLRELTDTQQEKLNKLEADREIVENKASEIVRDTLPNYANVYEFAKQLRGTPVVGSFVSFSAEVIRVSLNQIKLAASEMRDPKLRHIGLRRMFGMAAVGAITLFASDLISEIGFGWDDEERELLDKTMVPFWVPEAVYTTKNPDGTVNYFNLFTINPYTYLANPYFVFEKEGFTMEAGLDIVERLTNPFLNPEIGLQTLVYGLMNIDPVTGDPITTAPVSSPRHWYDIWNRMGFVANYFDPEVKKSGVLAPGFIKTIDRLLDPNTKEQEWTTLTTGVTSSVIKPVQTAFYKIRDAGAVKVDLDAQVEKVFKNEYEQHGEVTDRVRNKVDQMAVDHEMYLREVVDVVNAMKMLGVPAEKIKQLLDNARPKNEMAKTFRKDEVNWIMHGGKGSVPRYMYKVPKYLGGYKLWSRVNADIDRTMKDAQENREKRHKEKQKETQELLESPNVKPQQFQNTDSWELFKRLNNID